MPADPPTPPSPPAPAAGLSEVGIQGVLTCRSCDYHVIVAGHGSTLEEAEKALHEDIETEGFTDGLCQTCAGKRFLDEADKADHDNKLQRELDP